MPNQRSKSQSTDEEIKAMFEDAAQAGYSTSLIKKDGTLLDMANWVGNEIKRELLGRRWHEYINPTDLPHVLTWVAEDEAAKPICYWGIGPDPTKAVGHYVALTKRCGPNLRLIIGAVAEVTIPPMDYLPAPPTIMG